MIVQFPDALIRFVSGEGNGTLYRALGNLRNICVTTALDATAGSYSTWTDIAIRSIFRGRRNGHCQRP